MDKDESFIKCIAIDYEGNEVKGPTCESCGSEKCPLITPTVLHWICMSCINPPVEDHVLFIARYLAP